MNQPASYWIEKLRLEKHPEGGYFREVFRSTDVLEMDSLPERFPGDRYTLTCIYFLLEKNSFSAFHRLESDELWHYHAGDPLTIYLLNPHKEGPEALTTLHLGPHVDQDQALTIAIPHGNWFAARVDQGGSYSMVSCSVAPGFDYDDFYLAERDLLLTVFPEHEDIIVQLTRE